jgi:hypothetical protein
LVVLSVLLLGGAVVHIYVLTRFGLMFLALLMFWKVFSFRLHSLIKLGMVSIACGLAVVAWQTWHHEGGGPQVFPGGLLYLFDNGSPHFVINPAAIAGTEGLLFVVGLAVLPGLFWIRRHDSYARMSLALALPPALIVFNPWLAPWVYDRAPYLLHRLVLNAPVWIATVLVLGSLISWARRGNWPRKVFGFVLVFVWAELFAAGAHGWATEVRARRANDSASKPLLAAEKLVRFVDERIPAGSVILTDPATGLMLSAHCDVKVVALPGGSRSTGGLVSLDRIQAVQNALSPHTPQLETLTTIATFGVDYLLLTGSGVRPIHAPLWDWDPAAIDVLKTKLGHPPVSRGVVYEQGGWLMYEVNEGRASDDTWYPDLPFSRPSVGELSRCDVHVGTGLPRVVAAAVAPRDALAGETVEVTVAYQRDTEVPPGSPLVLRIRFDQIEYFRDAGALPGERYVRRLRERRDGMLRYEIRHRPFAGLYTPHMWPMGPPSYETIPVQLPSELQEGTYDLQLELERETLLPNATAKDLFFDSDSYGGTACTEVQVHYLLTR